MTVVSAPSAQSPYQAAIVALLKADAALTALVGTRIYDAVPDATVRNYVALGEWTEEPNDLLADGPNGMGSDMTVTIHTLTADDRGTAGYASGQAINGRVVYLLRNATLSVRGFESVLCQYEGSQSFRDDEDGRPVRHIVSTFRVVAEAFLRGRLYPHADVAGRYVIHDDATGTGAEVFVSAEDTGRFALDTADDTTDGRELAISDNNTVTLLSA